MKTESKRWTHLGLSAAIAGSAFLAACGETGGEHWTTAPAGQHSSDAGEGEGEGAPVTSQAPTVVQSDGGEGEGGVAIEKAGTDPVVFRAALAITEAHIIAARDAYIEGETQAAGEMFAHPVSEVLFDIGPYLEQQGVTPFDQMLLDASAAVFDGETTDEISARTDAIIQKLRAAARKAPDDDTGEAAIQAGVASDQIDRAAVMYGIAGESDEYEPYLDGYGFYHAAKAAYEMRKPAIQRNLPETAAAIETALTALEQAYPTVLRPEELPGNPHQLSALSSAVILTLSE